MSLGKIDDLVSQQALDQLDQLYLRLGITKDQMVSATEQAARFTAALSDTKSLQDFNAAQDKASASMQNVINTNATIISQQKEITTQTQTVTDAVKVKLTMDANADAVLKQVGGTLDANIKLLIQQKLELRNVSQEIKDLSKNYAGSVQSQNALAAKTQELTTRQISLKESIAQQNLVIRQQVKENNSAETSQDAMLARLNLLRKAYNSLSEEERNNAQVGGVMLAQIKELSTATGKINEEQGKYNDSVGKYENAIKSAISAYVPFGNQIVRSVDLFNTLTKETDAAGAATAGIGTRFAAFSIGEFAIGIAAATYYLQLFRNTGQDVEQFIGGLKNQFANLGKNIVDMFKQGKAINPFANFVNSFNTGVDITKAIQAVKNLNEVNDQQIQILQAQADQYRARAKNVKSSEEERIAALQKAQKIENGILKQQQDNASQNIEAGIGLAQKGTKPLLPSRLAQLRGQGAGGFNEAIQAANDLAQSGQITEAGYEALQAAYQRQTQAANAANMKLIRQQNDEARIGLKAAKEINNDELELQKAKLTGEKETAKLILDDDLQTYEARYAALKIYIDRSKALIQNENKIADRAPGISPIKKQVNAQNATNQNSQVDNFELQETQRLAKLQLAELEKQYNEEIKLAKEHDTKLISDLRTAGEDRVTQIAQDAEDAENALSEQRAKGLIIEKAYQQQLLDIKHQAKLEELASEIQDQEDIIKLKTDANPDADTGENQRAIAKLKRAYDQENATYTLQTDKAITASKQEAAAKEIELLNVSLNAVKSYFGAVNAAAEARLHHQEDLLQQQDNAEKAQINNSLLSSKEKARQIAVIDAQTASQKQVLQQKENQIKRKNAIEEKAAAVASIILNTAVAAVKVLGQAGIFGIPLEALVIAQGAIQLAAALAAPIPQFRHGGTVQKDGPIITGEAGTELRIDPSGSTSFTEDYANVTYAKAGTKIINNEELVKMLGKPEQVKYISTTTNDNRKMEKLLEQNNELLKKQKAPTVNVFNDKWGTYANRNY